MLRVSVRFARVKHMSCKQHLNLTLFHYLCNLQVHCVRLVMPNDCCTSNQSFNVSVLDFQHHYFWMGVSYIILQ